MPLNILLLQDFGVFLKDLLKQSNRKTIFALFLLGVCPFFEARL